MGTVHITQCLCSQRHCILAMAWEEPLHTPELAESRLQRVVEMEIADKRIDPWCPICHSREFHCEDGVTKFDSLEEAMPNLCRVEG